VRCPLDQPDQTNTHSRSCYALPLSSLPLSFCECVCVTVNCEATVFSSDLAPPLVGLSRIRPDMNGDSGGGGGGSISIRVPYRHLNHAELELVGLNGDPDPNSRPNGDSQDTNRDAKPRISTKRLVLSCTVAAGVQFGWALQLSLLTPYIQVNFLCSLMQIYYQNSSYAIIQFSLRSV
jgi:hypothetical protein